MNSDSVSPKCSTLTSASVLAMGNSTGDLPAAEVEAQLSLVSTVKVPCSATRAIEEAVRSQLALHPLLHFATHGMLSSRAALSSSILLAHSDDADLVLLSACETRRGDVTGGDDMIGLTRGLLAGGARAALVSLWPVDDLSQPLSARILSPPARGSNRC